jgi:predicted small lipoprotein YifL
MKRLISSLAALVAVACLVTACGQKGPLYLPDDSKSPEEQAVDQALQTLYVQASQGDGRCGHGPGRLLSSARKKQNPAT